MLCWMIFFSFLISVRILVFLWVFIDDFWIGIMIKFDMDSVFVMIRFFVFFRLIII